MSKTLPNRLATRDREMKMEVNIMGTIQVLSITAYILGVVWSIMVIAMILSRKAFGLNWLAITVLLPIYSAAIAILSKDWIFAVLSMAAVILYVLKVSNAVKGGNCKKND